MDIELKNGNTGNDFNVFTRGMIKKFLSETFEMLDGAEKAILEIENKDSAGEAISSAFRYIHTLKGNAGFFNYEAIELQAHDLETVLDTIRRDNEQINKEVISELLKAADEIRKLLGHIRVPEEEEAGGAKAEDVKPEDQSLLAARKQHKTENSVKVPGEPDKLKKKDIRVDTERLDRLFDLMGELITAEAMVISSEELKGLELPEFTKSAAYLVKITKEIQEITMFIRMIPLEGLFHKMKRLVRDLSRKSGKKISLSISGQETEMDRNVMEKITDPLIHIMRNAIDHGIERPEERTAAGKKDTGNIFLTAGHEGNEIWISIRDDGKGLNREKILKKALEQGLVNGDGSDMKDPEIWPLIFEPGFSTAQTVTDISGRGVGMDVVKKNIEKLRGQVKIITSSGHGSEFVIKIPLTLAIIEGVEVRVGSGLYTIPLNDIVEFFKPEEKHIVKTTGEQEVIRLRNQIIPVLRLHDFFKIDSRVKDIREGILILVKSGEQTAALFADKIIGNQQLVIKGLPEYLKKIKGVSGCSILADGKVSLIVDVSNILKNVFDSA